MTCHSAIYQTRRASVLVLTLIVVAMLTLGAAAFFERMFAEHRASRAGGRQLQARHLAESGVEYIGAVLMQTPTTIQSSGGLYYSPNLFQAILVADDPLAEFRGRFSVLAPDMSVEGLFSGVRFGLENESSRLNLNTVLLADSGGQDGARKLLMTLPGMTEPIADAILDWIDPDDQPRTLGAERDYYSSLSPPYAPRNGPLGSIEELLLVRGVTPALLFGADLNRNVVVDGAEDSLTAIDGVDNSTGMLNRGWAAYLTLDSAESNLRADGSRKINVNRDDLQELHKELVDVLGTEMANFIIAYRQSGPYRGSRSGQPASGTNIDFTRTGRYRLNSLLDLIGARTQLPLPGADPSSNQAGESGDQSGESGQSGRGRYSRRGRGSDRGPVVEAAFGQERGAMQSYLSKLMDNLTVQDSPSLPGRININQAPRSLLAGIPGLTPTEIDQIVANRDMTLGQVRPEQTHATWVLADGIVDLAKMKQISGFITTGGSVYRAQVVGFYDAEGPADRLEVVIDATQSRPIVRRRWELRELGPGYTAELLGAMPDGP